MMIALEFGPPKSLKLKAAYTMLDKANKGLFCQLILIPLFKKHRILAQVAGHAMTHQSAGTDESDGGHAQPRPT